MRSALPRLLSALCIACTPDPSIPSDPLRPADTGAPAPDGPGIGGTLIDGRAQPVAGAEVLACSDAWCLSEDSERDGSFWFTIDPEVSLAVKVAEGGSGDTRSAAVLRPCAVADDAPVDLGSLYRPALPADRPWGPVQSDPQTFYTEGGLVLTMRRADIALAVFGTFDDVASVALPEEQLPRYDLIDAEEVIAVYALHPFDASSRSPVALRAPAELPAGTVVHFRSIDTLDGSFSDPVAGRSDGLYAETDEGQGLTQLTYVVLSIP